MRTLAELKVTISETKSSVNFQVEKDTPTKDMSILDRAEIYTAIISHVHASETLTTDQKETVMVNVVDTWLQNMSAILMNRSMKELLGGHNEEDCKTCEEEACKHHPSHDKEE